MEANISNALVSQKDQILGMVGRANFAAKYGVCGAEEIAKACDLFLFVRPLWLVADYAYKVEEVRKKIIEAAYKEGQRLLHDDEQDFIHGFMKSRSGQIEKMDYVQNVLRIL